MLAIRVIKKKSIAIRRKRETEIVAPFVLCPIPSLLCSFATPSSLFNSVFSKIRKAGCIFSSFFSLNFLGFLFHPYWKTVLNSGCTIVELCFGLGLYHHESNSKPTHTDYDFVGQSNGSESLYLWVLRDF